MCTAQLIGLCALAATQEQYRGEVIGFRKEDGGQHLVLYDDGEDEWIDVSQEEPVWQAPLPGPSACPAPGLPPGRPFENLALGIWILACALCTVLTHVSMCIYGGTGPGCVNVSCAAV